MSDRKRKRLMLLYRLREMRVEEARADHVAAQVELDARREKADGTESRLKALDEWTVGHLVGGAPLIPEVLHQAGLYRGVEKDALERQRAEEAKSRELTEAARGTLTARFEELSAIERLSARHAQTLVNQQIRAGFVALDEAGIRKTLEPKE
jgi:hypothetical protein